MSYVNPSANYDRIIIRLPSALDQGGIIRLVLEGERVELGEREIVLRWSFER